MWKVVSYGVIGNDKDGYEVNDAHYTGETLSFPDQPTNKQICKALKECGILRKTVQFRHLDIDQDNPNNIYVYQRRNRKPLWELRLSQ